MSKPKIHFIFSRDPDSGEIRTRCGKWLLNPQEQSTTDMQEVTCKWCKDKTHPAYEDYAGDGTDQKMEGQ